LLVQVAIADPWVIIYTIQNTFIISKTWAVVALVAVVVVVVVPKVYASPSVIGRGGRAVAAMALEQRLSFLSDTRFIASTTTAAAATDISFTMTTSHRSKTIIPPTTITRAAWIALER